MSDQEEKTPWYATESMGQVYVLFILSLVFLAFMGWNEFIKLLLEQAIPFALLGALVAYITKIFINEDFSDLWLIFFIVLMALHLVGYKLFGFPVYILEGFIFPT